MNTILGLLFVAGFLVGIWYLRIFLKITIYYKEARAAEVKRRLQVEHKNEEALKHNLANEADDNVRLKMEMRAAHERHQRAIHYVIEDMFEKYQ